MLDWPAVVMGRASGTGGTGGAELCDSDELAPERALFMVSFVKNMVATDIPAHFKLTIGSVCWLYLLVPSNIPVDLKIYKISLPVARVNWSIITINAKKATLYIWNKNYYVCFSYLDIELTYRESNYFWFIIHRIFKFAHFPCYNKPKNAN